MKLYFSVFALFLSTALDAQINLDSLRTESEREYIPKRSSNGWNAYTILYLNEDSLVFYEIPFNHQDEIEEDIWGIALISNRYDKMGRVIETRYFDRNGNLTFTDWPPIIQYSYNKRGLLESKMYLNKNEEPVSSYARLEIDYDDDGDQIEDRMYDGDFNLTDENCITRYEYNKEKNEVTRSRYNKDNDLHDPLGWAYLVEKFETDERQVLIERRYLDRNRQLTNGNNRSKQNYAIIRYKHGLRANWIKLEHYDENDQFIKETWQYAPAKK